MAWLAWKKELETGIEKIDEQHKYLFELINTLHDATSTGLALEASEVVLNELVDYVFTHFATEESWFTRTAYPDAQVHLLQHQGLRTRVGNLREKFEKDPSGTQNEVATFLKHWLLHHIEETDTKFAGYLKENNIL